MAAQFVSGTVLKTIQKGGKAIAVQVVDKTTAWKRPPNYPIARVTEEFAEIVEENIETLDPSTTSVAMKYVYTLYCALHPAYRSRCLPLS